MSKIRIVAATCAALLALAGVVACSGSVTPTPTASPVHTAPFTRPATPTTRPTTPAPPVSAEQRNAARDAQAYLDMQPFSRTGLIRQLSSDSGDGYTAKDATAAVDSLHVDWNAQAVKAAKGYLSMSGFSRKGLTEQLEADAGDAFTHAQAVYGVAHSGL